MSGVKYTPRITPTMLRALQTIEKYKSMRGRFNAVTYTALRRQELIEDPETLTDAGRAAIAKATGSDHAR